MSTVPTAVETQSIVDAWPRGDVGLPASVAACYTAWMTQNLPVIDPAIAAFLTAAPGYVTPARFNKAEKCRVLVANAVPPPGGTSADIAELRTMIPAGALPTVEQRLDAMALQMQQQAAELLAAKNTIASLERSQGADDDTDASTDYEIHETVVKALPTSFLELHPLSRKERQKVTREHCGTFPEGAWPRSLALKDSTKSCKEMQSAQKLTLSQCAVEVAKHMDHNGTATKIIGTAWSRVLDIEDQLNASIDTDPLIVFKATDVTKQLLPVSAALAAAFRASLDTSAHLRLDVGKRVDTAMGIDHLRYDPTKREKDDFISPDTYQLVEKEAKHKQNIAWAKKGVSQQGSFLGKPLRNDSRSGNKSGGGGRGKGNKSSGGGRGSGKSAAKKPKGGGKGKGKDTPPAPTSGG